MRTSLLPVSKWAENPSRSITAVAQYRTSDGSRAIWFISITLARDGAWPWHPKASPLGSIVPIPLNCPPPETPEKRPSGKCRLRRDRRPLGGGPTTRVPMVQQVRLDGHQYFERRPRPPTHTSIEADRTKIRLHSECGQICVYPRAAACRVHPHPRKPGALDIRRFRFDADTFIGNGLSISSFITFGLVRRRRNAIWVTRQTQIGAEAESNHWRAVARSSCRSATAAAQTFTSGRQTTSAGRSSISALLSECNEPGRFDRMSGNDTRTRGPSPRRAFNL